MDDLLLIPHAGDAERLLARRLRATRKARGHTQAELARRSGVSVATIARLERTGQGQIRSLLQVLQALGRLRDLEALLAPAPPDSLEALRRQLLEERR